MKHKKGNIFLSKKWIPITLTGSVFFLGTGLFYNTETVLAKLNESVEDIKEGVTHKKDGETNNENDYFDSEKKYKGELEKPLTPLEELKESRKHYEKKIETENSKEKSKSPLVTAIPEIPVSHYNNEGVEGGLVILPEDEVELPDYIDDSEVQAEERSVQNTTTITYTKTIFVGKDVQYIEDNILKPGETKIVSEGKDGQITQKYEMVFNENDNIINNSIGDEVVSEAKPMVVHYKSGEDIPENNNSDGIRNKITITNISQSGKGQLNALAYFAFSEVNERLEKLGYATSHKEDCLSVFYDGDLHDGRDHDDKKDLNMLINQNIGNEFKYKLINKKTSSDFEKNTLSAVGLFRKEFTKINANDKLFSLISSGVLIENDLPAVLVDIKSDSINEMDTKQLNKYYENIVTVLTETIQRHMKAVYGDG